MTDHKETPGQRAARVKAKRDASQNRLATLNGQSKEIVAWGLELLRDELRQQVQSISESESDCSLIVFTSNSDSIEDHTFILSCREQAVKLDFVRPREDSHEGTKLVVSYPSDSKKHNEYYAIDMKSNINSNDFGWIRTYESGWDSSCNSPLFTTTKVAEVLCHALLDMVL